MHKIDFSSLIRALIAKAGNTFSLTSRIEVFYNGCSCGVSIEANKDGAGTYHYNPGYFYAEIVDGDGNSMFDWGLNAYREEFIEITDIKIIHSVRGMPWMRLYVNWEVPDGYGLEMYPEVNCNKAVEWDEITNELNR